LQLTLDSAEMALTCAEAGAHLGVVFPILIELDTDGHRAGVDPRSEDLVHLGHVLHESTNTQLLGVMTHAGESYACHTLATQRAMARQERDLSLLAARRLAQAGLPCPVVSVGSTPTAFAIDDLAGVTEVRAGVYTFFDLVMAGLGVCAPQDIALSVLVSVNGHQKQRNWLITDGGWMAMSRDRGTAGQPQDQGYGLVLDAAGQPFEDLIVKDANQEHGIITRRDGHDPLPWDRLPVGTLLRVLPNHACATAGQYDGYVVVDGEALVGRWDRINGW
ncbi:MAG: alanine racemase, partial [Pseudomonadota bacterium]